MNFASGFAENLALRRNSANVWPSADRPLVYQDLALTLLETRVLLVNDIQLPLPSHDLTIGAAFFDRCTYFHNNCYYLYLNIILPLVRS